MMDDSDRRAEHGNVARFPQARVRPPGMRGGYKTLGLGCMAEQLAMDPERTSGHWCGRCGGIWFGCLLEVTCPACGSRRG